MLPWSREDPNQARIATLKSTISELEASIEGLRADLADKDAELVKLRAALAERQAALTANTQTVQSERYPGSRVVEMIEPFWPWFWVSARPCWVVHYPLVTNKALSRGP